ncbi:MAG: sugar phosphate isomerase/epimerase [Anaerolineae bacterium]|nr:sugar phosphate isomerase/epimerase [Anaerolineae bacterium]
MFRLAVSVGALPGTSLEEQVQAAAAAGFDGVEFACSEAEALDVAMAASALQASGLAASSIRAGHTYLIHPDYNMREKALFHLRRAMAASVDLGAAGVVFYGHYASHTVLPDLHPYKSAIELEAELLITQLRATLCDLAYALGTRLLLMPADHTCSTLLTHPDHAQIIRSRVDEHPHLQLALHYSHLTAEGIDLARWAGRDAVKVIATHHDAKTLHDIAPILINSGFDGWLVVDSGHPLSLRELQLRVQALHAAQPVS